jgi:uncharacterized membrane protein
VHRWGFYHPQNTWSRPAPPQNLHWFYWESYSTWLTGFALFTVLYLFNAVTFLVDKKVYDRVCRRGHWCLAGLSGGLLVCP